MKRTPVEWQEIYGVIIHDPDGWRGKNDPHWDDPIDEDTWVKCMGVSTIFVHDREKFDAAELAYGEKLW